MPVRLRAALLGALLVVACGDGANGDGPSDGGGSGADGGPLPPVPGTLSIEVPNLEGEGYGPAEPGAERLLEPGSQGGFHLPIQLRIDAEAREALGEISYHARTARRTVDGQLVADSGFNVQWFPAGDGTYVLQAATFVFLCPTPIDVEVADQELRVQAAVGRPEEWVPLTATTTVTMRCPDGDVGEFCDQICRG